MTEVPKMEIIRKKRERNALRGIKHSIIGEYCTVSRVRKEKHNMQHTELNITVYFRGGKSITDTANQQF